MTISINRLTSLLTKYKSWFACLAILLAPPIVLGDAPQVQFTDVTAVSGINFRHLSGAQGEYHLPETMGAGGAFFDYDNDGDLDLYLINSGYLTDAESQASVMSMLYRNNGDGTFTDTTDQAGVGNAGNYGMGAACADYDNDGDADLYVTNFGANILYQNNGDGTFTDITEKSGVGDELLGSSATFFDYDRDGTWTYTSSTTFIMTLMSRAAPVALRAFAPIATRNTLLVHPTNSIEITATVHSRMLPKRRV